MSSYLVPIDFTSASFNALKLAEQLAAITGAKIQLLHFCEEIDEVEKSREKLEAIFTDSGLEVDFLVRIGTYEEIGKTAIELDSEFIFMGTHGAKGMKKITGSNALKTILESETPYIVVQDGAFHENMKSIVVPISFHVENIQKLREVCKLATSFNSTIHLVCSWPKEGNSNLTVTVNLETAKQFLQDQGVEFTIFKSAGKFNEDTLRVAELKNAGLIAIMNMQKAPLIAAGILRKDYEQQLIDNKRKIPVLIMNPED